MASSFFMKKQSQQKPKKLIWAGNTFKYFFFFMSVLIPRLYLNIIKKYIFLKHHQIENQAHTTGPLKGPHTTQFINLQFDWLPSKSVPLHLHDGRSL